MPNTIKKIRNLMKISKFSSKYESFSESALRHYIFNADRNGFSKAIKRIGRKVLIDEEEFFNWIEQQQNKGGVK
jgi:hypothetical protein